MKNILILSCKAGEGHNAAAKALVERIEHEGHKARIVDFLGLSSDKASDVLNDSYVSMAKHTPHLFGAIYHLGLSVSRHLHRGHSPLYWASSKMAPKILELLETEQFDAIIATHLFPALAIAYLNQKGHKLPLSIAVATDYTCYPFWEEASCDYYILAHEDMAEEYEKRGIPADKMKPYGIPTSMRFLNLPTREQAKEQLHMDPAKKMYLIMGGSMGAGHLRSFTKKMTKHIGDAELVVICGRNDNLRRALEKRFGNEPHVHIIGFTTEVPLYMAACDVLFTKPGGLTSSEALVCKAPLVHTAPIPGCESDNFKFFAQNGLSMPAKHGKKLLQYGKQLAEESEKQQHMRNCQERCAKPDAALNILRLIEEYSEVKDAEEAACSK